ncbi:MAG: DUF4252 domain-containing protein [Bacteroidota bacterium]
MKKWLIAAFCACLLPALVSAQSPSINKFYRQNKFEEGVRKVKLPGWLIRLGSRIGAGQIDEADQEAREALKMARRVRKMRMLYGEEGNPIDQRKVDKLIRNVRKKDNFQDLIYVRDEEGTKVNLLIRTNGAGDLIRNLLILVQSEDEFVMVGLKTKLSIKDINTLIQNLPEEADIKVKVPVPELDPEPEITDEPEV